MDKTQVPVKDNGQETLPAPRRQSPWTMFEELWSDFDLDLDRFSALRPRFPRLRFRGASPLQLWRPDVDVFKQEGQLIIKADLPGMKKEDVQVLIEDGKLVVKGERVEESKVEEDDFFRAERSYGSFYRSVPLPPDVDESQIEARFVSGVLEVRVTLPEPERKDVKRIEVK